MALPITSLLVSLLTAYIFSPKFRYQPDSVLVNTPEAYRHMFGPTGNMKKGLFYEVWPRNVKTLTVWNSTSLEVHGRKRRVLNHAFSDKALRSAESFVISNADRWCDIIAEEIPETGWSKSMNMTDWVNYLVFDILGDLCFGKSFDMKERDSDMKFLPHIIVDFVTLMYPIAHSPFASLWVWLKPRGLDKLISMVSPPALTNWERFVENCLEDRTRMEQREDNKGGRKDFFHYLYHATDPETGKRGFSLDELYGECESLIIAGSDTTSIVIVAMFFHLSRKPEMQEKLAREVRSKFTNSNEIGHGSALHSCKYLNAFIQEALRMTPPVSADPSREVLKGGSMIDGDYFPAGVHVSTGFYCLSYNQTIFPRPFDFRPERWMAGEASAQSIALAERAFCAFSYGPRGCPGRNLAWLEMSIVMAKVIHNFEVKQDASNQIGGGRMDGKLGRRTVEQYQTYDVFVSLRDGPMVQFKRRERPSEDLTA